MPKKEKKRKNVQTKVGKYVIGKYHDNIRLQEGRKREIGG